LPEHQKPQRDEKTHGLRKRGVSSITMQDYLQPSIHLSILYNQWLRWRQEKVIALLLALNVVSATVNRHPELAPKIEMINEYLDEIRSAILASPPDDVTAAISIGMMIERSSIVYEEVFPDTDSDCSGYKNCCRDTVEDLFKAIGVVFMGSMALTPFTRFVEGKPQL
jgi:hypothetical protein